MLSLTTSKKSFDKYLFDINDYKTIKTIKGGSYGCIRYVMNIKNGGKYIAKITKEQKLNQFASREINILIRIQHETIIPFRGFSYVDFKNKNRVTFLMDYMENGSLYELMKKDRKEKHTRLTPTIKQIILVGIARGMMLLHKYHVFHRDLKPHNILIDSNFRPHIADFGLSKFFDANNPTEQTKSGLGTLLYMAPEVSDECYDNKADVYSFGILMYEVITGKKAFEKIRKSGFHKIVEELSKGARPLEHKGTIKPKGLEVMMEMCWDQNPNNRPSFSEIFKKLSLSTDDFLLGFENNPDKEIIQVSDSEDDEEAEFEEMKNKGINTRFCLKDVDHNQVLQYVDEILVEPKNQQNEEIEELKKEIDSLKETTKAQATLIEQLQKPNEKKDEAAIDNDDDKKDEIKDLKKEIDDLKETTKSQVSIIEKLQKSTKKKQKTIDENKEEISDLKKEISKLKKTTKSQATLIEQLQNSNNEKEKSSTDDEKKEEVIENLKGEILTLKEATKSQADLLEQIKISNEQDRSVSSNEETEEQIENMMKEIDKLKKKTKNQESTILTLKNKLKNSSDNIMDTIMENVDQVKQQQQEMIKKQQEKIEHQEEQIKKQKEKIEQQEKEIKKKQNDIMSQFEIFKKQIKELTEKISKDDDDDQSNSEKENHSNSDDDNDDNEDKEKSNSDSDTNKKSNTESDEENESEKEPKSQPESDNESEKEIYKTISSESDKESEREIYKTISSESDKESESDSNREENSDDESKEKSIDDLEIGLIESFDTMPNGIIHFLKDNVVITAGGSSASVNNIRCIGGSGFINYYNYKPKSEDESFIEFDFGYRFRVYLTFYLIHTFKQNNKTYPKSWKIIGSNDQKKWEVLDEKEDMFNLKDNFSDHFYCQYPGYDDENHRFRYIRFVQYDSWCSTKPYHISILFFELFGNIYKIE